MDFAPAEEYALILWDHGGGPWTVYAGMNSMVRII